MPIYGIMYNVEYLEHSLELAGVLEATGLLQLADHGGLRVVAG